MRRYGRRPVIERIPGALNEITAIPPEHVEPGGDTTTTTTTTVVEEIIPGECCDMLFVACDNGELYLSRDNGVAWERRHDDVSANISGGAMLDHSVNPKQRHKLAIGPDYALFWLNDNSADPATMQKTTDGLVWSDPISITNTSGGQRARYLWGNGRELLAAFPVSSSSSTAPEAMAYSTNGTSWTHVDLPSAPSGTVTARIRDAYYDAGSDIWALIVAYGSSFDNWVYVYSSTNGGASWTFEKDLTGLTYGSFDVHGCWGIAKVGTNWVAAVNDTGTATDSFGTGTLVASASLSGTWASIKSPSSEKWPWLTGGVAVNDDGDVLLATGPVVNYGTGSFARLYRTTDGTTEEDLSTSTAWKTDLGPGDPAFFRFTGGRWMRGDTGAACAFGTNDGDLWGWAGMFFDDDVIDGICWSTALAEEAEA